MFWIKIKHPHSQCCRPLLFTSIPRVCYDLSWETRRHWAAPLAHAALLAGPLLCRTAFLHLVLLQGRTHICTHVAKSPRIRGREQLCNFHYKEVTENLLFFELKKCYLKMHFPGQPQCFSYSNSSKESYTLIMNGHIILTKIKSNPPFLKKWKLQ